jgi:prepilin-type N-terminal cleavage/methylation domain-containing protein
MKRNKISWKKGGEKSHRAFTLIEVLVAMAVMLIVVATILPTVSWLISRSAYLKYDAQAGVLLQEGMEVAYNLAAADWDNFTTSFPDGVYHPAVDVTTEPNMWTLVFGPESGLEARFERQVSVSPVCRDGATGGIVAGECGSGSVWDSASKLLTVSIKWQENQSDKEINSTLLVTDFSR